MSIVAITSKMDGVSHQPGHITISTEQSVGGSGSRNLITWALIANKKGFYRMTVEAPNANPTVRASLHKAIANANDLLNMHGMTIEAGF